MGRAKVDVILIIPEQGRWVYTKVLDCVEFFEFGANRCSYREEWDPSKIASKPRKHALRRALKLELKRQSGELELRPMN